MENKAGLFVLGVVLGGAGAGLLLWPKAQDNPATGRTARQSADTEAQARLQLEADQRQDMREAVPGC